MNKITDHLMSSAVTRHTATPTAGGWSVSWLPGRTLDRNEAITAMMLAELVATTENPMSDNTEFWALADSFAAELGLAGADAVVRASFSPEDAEPAETLGRRACPAWCSERHEGDAEPCWGPAYDVTTRSLTDPVMVCLQQEPDREVEISIEPTSLPTVGEDRARTFTVDQARQLYAALGELLAVVDEQHGGQGA